MQKREYGLGPDWRPVMRSLEKLAPVYDMLNKTISFNTDIRLRAECLDGNVGLLDRVLDAGSGPGVFTETLLRTQKWQGEVVMLDPLPSMHMLARKKMPQNTVHQVVAVFEQMPFREEVFDTVLMGFSLRDAANMAKALSETRKILRKGGRLLVVDLGKPANILKRIAIGVYWALLAPLLAALKLGKTGLEAAAIYLTYRRLPTNKELKSLLKTFFDTVEVGEKMLGGVVIIRAS
ncbi:MAG: class I SAM-dependent methyltransferase [Aigarchaeota archaeon]|jgi:demethylmenaquinone methyltransferase/2-methoxy-6-polyprenyl-1,4-benzoquinol methylase|nr:class I SAM-dependent methyltransferase [Candidatus Caldarchaeales archaeon]